MFSVSIYMLYVNGVLFFIADVIPVIPALEHVVADFQKTSATSHLHKAALLLVCVAIHFYLVSYHF